MLREQKEGSMKKIVRLFLLICIVMYPCSSRGWGDRNVFNPLFPIKPAVGNNEGTGESDSAKLYIEQ